MTTLTIGGASVATLQLPARLAAKAEDEAATCRAAVRRAVNAAMEENGEHRIGAMVVSAAKVGTLLGRIDRSIIRQRLVLAYAGFCGGVGLVFTYIMIVSATRRYALGLGPTDAAPGFQVLDVFGMLSAFLAATLASVVLDRVFLRRIEPLQDAISEGAFELSAGQGKFYQGRLYVGRYQGGSAHVREIRFDAVGKAIHEKGELTLLDRAGRTILVASGLQEEEGRTAAYDMVAHIRSRIPA